MVRPPRPDGDTLARSALALVCAVVLIVPIFIGDFGEGRLPPSPVERVVPAQDRSGREPAPRAPEDSEPAAAPAPPAAAVRQAARLPVDEQAAQVLLVGFEGIDLTARVYREIRDHGWGGIVITPDNALSVEAVGQLAGEADAVARQARKPPPLVVAEPNGAPAQPDLADATPARVRERYRRAGRRLREAGVNLAFGPVVDVGAAAAALNDTVFSDDPAVVAALSRAAVDGWLAGGVAPAPGHFPGQGAASLDPLDGPANVGLSRTELAQRDLAALRTALVRAPAVVVSSASFTAWDPVTPAALVPAITRGLLRTTLRFDGAAVSDDLAGLVAATGESSGATAVRALRSGIDLVYVPDPTQRDRVYASVLAAARSGRLPKARLREAVARVLELKRRAS